MISYINYYNLKLKFYSPVIIATDFSPCVEKECEEKKVQGKTKTEAQDHEPIKQEENKIQQKTKNEDLKNDLLDENPKKCEPQQQQLQQQSQQQQLQPQQQQQQETHQKQNRRLNFRTRQYNRSFNYYHPHKNYYNNNNYYHGRRFERQFDKNYHQLRKKNNYRGCRAGFKKQLNIQHTKRNMEIIFSGILNAASKYINKNNSIIK